MANNALEKWLRQTRRSWHSSYLDHADLPKEISSIEFCAHGDMADTKQRWPPNNRWAMLLITGADHAVSIEICSKARSPHATCTVVVRTRKYPIPGHDYRVTVPATPPPGSRVQDVLLLLIRRRRDHYRLTEFGEGHRWWMHKISCDMRYAKLLSTANVVKLHKALSRYWRTPAEKGFELTPLEAGAFY